MQATISRPTLSPTQRDRLWVGLDIVLALIIMGPVIAPLFVRSGLWPLPWVAREIIYPLGHFICPQDHYSLSYLGGVMAVCTRCYAAIGGLFLVRAAMSADHEGTGFASRLARWWRRRSMAVRALLIVTVIGVWWLDIVAGRIGIVAWSQPVMIATGPIIGLAVGFLAYGLLAALTGRAAAWDDQSL